MSSIYAKLQWIAPYLYPKYSLTIDNINLNPILKQLCNENKGCPQFSNRREYFRYIGEEIIKGNPIDYLEFGVYKGDSIKEWININQHPESRFYVFDTFEGLPEDWSYSIKAGYFNVDGNIPDIKDSRVKMIKGLFQDTLRPFLKTFVRNNRIVVHLDADLFSSTLYVLTQLDSILNKDDILMFDRFNLPAGEFKAFIDYKSAYYRKFKMIAKIPSYKWVCAQVAFVIER
jgi:hypothetical protein